MPVLPRSLAAPCSLLVALAAALPASGSILRGPADVASLAAGADAVVRARVERVESHWGAEGPRGGVIYTTALLVPADWWKGTPEPGALLVRSPGGAVGEWTQTVHGAAALRAGEEVVVFLTRKASAGGRARARAVRPASGSASASASSPGGLDALPDLAVYEVHAMAMGKYALGSVAGGRVRALRDRTGLLCQGCGAEAEDDLPLDELRARVLRAPAAPPPRGAR